MVDYLSGLADVQAAARYRCFWFEASYYFAFPLLKSGISGSYRKPDFAQDENHLWFFEWEIHYLRTPVIEKCPRNPRLYAVNAHAQTPLHCAAGSGSSAVVQDRQSFRKDPKGYERIEDAMTNRSTGQAVNKPLGCCETVPGTNTGVSLVSLGTPWCHEPVWTWCPKFSRWLGVARNQYVQLLEYLGMSSETGKLPQNNWQILHWLHWNCSRCLQVSQISHRNLWASRDVEEIFLKMSWITWIFTLFPFFPHLTGTLDLSRANSSCGRTWPWRPCTLQLKFSVGKRQKNNGAKSLEILHPVY